MIAFLRRSAILYSILLTLTVFVSAAQPVLPDMTGTTEKNVVILSWSCQYDGVKSIAVLRSYDSNFNYSTIGYVKKLYKGVQAFADGHPNPGKNFYKLSIVFNSGLTWSSNHYGVNVDSASLRAGRALPSNEALQKMIVTEPQKTNATETKATENKNVAAADTIEAPKHRPKLTFNDPEDVNAYVDMQPEATRKKMTLSYEGDPSELDPDKYIDKQTRDKDKEPQEKEKKKITLSFKDDADMAAYIEKLPEETRRKIKLTEGTDTTRINPDAYIESVKKETAKQSDPKHIPEVVTAPPQPAPRPRITIAFNDEPLADNVSNTVKSRYVAVNPGNGHIELSLPDDVGTHHYSIKFYDKDNHMVLEVPKINTPKIILDKRNFQKKGTYKFAIKKDILELEHGYITIY